MSNWADLLPELLNLITNYLYSSKDFTAFKDLISFGGVCSSWRSVAKEHNLHIPPRPFPWLMLAEKQDDVREFYSVTDGKTYTYNLPELKGKMCFETKGWIVTLSIEGEMALVHPLTRVVISLPHRDTSEFYDDNIDPLFFLQKAVLLSPPKPGEKCVLMILHMGLCHIAFWRTGDKRWTAHNPIMWGFPPKGFQSIEFYREKLYAMDNDGQMWELDLIGATNNNGSVKLTGVKLNYSFVYAKRLYLVESEGSLLVVSRNGIYVDDDDNYGASEFNVFEIDVEQGKYHKIESLGSTTIFLGYNATLSVDTMEYPGLIPNSIYFTDDNGEMYLDKPEGGGKDMGVYNLFDKTIQPHYRGRSMSLVCPPVWTFLTIK